MPYLQTSSSNAQVAITVVWHDGNSGYGSCGHAEGYTIDLWAASIVNGQPTPCGAADIVAQSLAHELGHVLGLNNSDCGGWIMSPLYLIGGSFVQRSVQPEECQEADVLNVTQYEQQNQPPSDCELHCPIHCEDDICHWNQWNPPGSPILIDLDEGGIKLGGPSDPVAFDLNADGEAEHMTWPARGSATGFLVLDRNGNGTVDNGGELFGDHTSVSIYGGTAAANGFVALAEFDTRVLGGNADGRLTAEDFIFSKLRIWLDVNHNGISEPGELMPLSDVGIVAIELAYHRDNRKDRYGNLLRFKGKAWMKNGQGHEHAVTIYDAFLLTVQP